MHAALTAGRAVIWRPLGELRRVLMVQCPCRKWPSRALTRGSPRAVTVAKLSTRIPVIRPAISRALSVRSSSMMLRRWSLAPAWERSSSACRSASSSSVSFIGPVNRGPPTRGTIGSVTAAVAAPNAMAVRAGLHLVEAGGTAVDAAIAAMLVAMCTEPGVVSPLGGGFVAIWPHDGDPEVIDANVEMPGRGVPRERFGAGLVEFSMSYGGGITVYAGPGSVATPGALSGLGLAHERHGRAPWREVVAPAATAAREGYPLGAAAASYLAITGDSLFAWDPETAALLLHPGGEPLMAGERIVDPHLAAALDRLGEAGTADLYSGDLAR